MNYKALNKMGDWELRKATFLINTALDLGMDLSGYGEVGVNPNSGNVYLWLEDYPFALYMPINCKLQKTDVWAVWDDPETSEETELKLKDETNLENLLKWANDLYNKDFDVANEAV